VLGFDHTIPENRPGADLTTEAARQIASAFAVAQGSDLNSMGLKESASEKEKVLARSHLRVGSRRC
jgi:hypothetical protein